jgi:hypothetical protein
MIGIDVAGLATEHSNYPDDPVRVRVPEPQAANSETRLARTPIFGADSLIRWRQLGVGFRAGLDIFSALGIEDLN